MDHKLANKKIAILATDGVEESELTEPRKALDEEGALTELVSINPGEIKAWKKEDWANPYQVDKVVDDIETLEYDALFLPGGAMNPDKLRTNEKAVAFVKKFFDENKPVAAICHAPSLLIEAGVVKGKKITSWQSIKTDLKNA